MRLRSTFVALAVLALSMGSVSDVTELAVDGAAHRITIATTSPEWTRLVEWGLDRFRIAGLELPSMVIAVHDDQSHCEGNSGLYLPTDPVEVHLCTTGSADSRPARLTILHELAHAWAEAHLSSADRAAFLELRGLDVWYDDRVPRHERGMEHAAEVVSWGLMDEKVPIIRIYDADPADLSIAFELLVNRPPLWS